MHARKLNRIAPERFEEAKRRGYDIIDNRNFGQGHKEKHFHEPFTKDRSTPWEKVMEARGPLEEHTPPAASTLPGNATLKLPAESSRQKLSNSSSAQQLRSSDSVASSQRRPSGLRHSESMGASTVPRPAATPAPPGFTKALPPAPTIPGSDAGSVYSRPKG